MMLWGACSFLLFGVGLVRCVQKPQLRKIPDSLIFGTSTSSYQIEGGWDADGKTESVWDHLTHTKPQYIVDQSTGDIADDSYHLYKRDVEMLRELGVDFYRFSVSWTRVLPSSFPDKINPDGVQYYNNLIDELLKYNIQPIITLLHWDLPQKLQELGGLTNSNIVTWFSDYARVLFRLFGDRVKYFITINEPQTICYYGYGQGILDSAVNKPGFAEYICAKNLLVAHATAYHIYDKEFRAAMKGNVFISINAEWYEPATETDVDATLDAIQFNIAQYAWPIFSKTGDFPPVLKDRIAAKSLEQGYPSSRLPEFTAEEIELVKGSSDLFGLNHYSTRYVYRNASVPTYEVPSFDNDLNVSYYQLQEWRIGESNNTKYVPWGFTKILNHIRVNYNNPPVLITENGLASLGGLHDDDRVKYYRGYIDALLDAVDDGCDVRGYSAWSLMDNFEWVYGYTQCYGLYEVDYASVNLTRTPRKSAFVYKEILRSRRLDHHYEPDLSAPITIDDGH